MKISMKYILSTITLIFLSCSGESDVHSVIKEDQETVKEETIEREGLQTQGVEIIVLGEAQDAGAPQLYCEEKCCIRLRDNNDRKLVSCIGVKDLDNSEYYLFDATPDMDEQLEHFCEKGSLDGIFLTHAHIGHYTGLMYLGREAHSAEMVPVFAMPKMAEFLRKNGPWSLLVENGNIDLVEVENEGEVQLNSQLLVKPFLVPHRDEFSETVGYKIIGPKKTALFIPDIDKWDEWEKDIKREINEVDIALIDATFYDEHELKGRDMSEIPHPFVVETMKLFQEESEELKNKVYFIHINHSNPILDEDSEEAQQVISNGFNIAYEGTRIAL